MVCSLSLIWLIGSKVKDNSHIVVAILNLRLIEMKSFAVYLFINSITFIADSNYFNKQSGKRHD